MAILETRAFGLIAAIATVTIWAGFMLITRFAVKSDFTVEELLVLRLLPGAIVIIPWMWKLGVMPPKMAWPRAAMLMVGASAVHRLYLLELLIHLLHVILLLHLQLEYFLTLHQVLIQLILSYVITMLQEMS